MQVVIEFLVIIKTENERPEKKKKSKTNIKNGNLRWLTVCRDLLLKEKNSSEDGVADGRTGRRAPPEKEVLARLILRLCVNKSVE